MGGTTDTDQRAYEVECADRVDGGVYTVRVTARSAEEARRRASRQHRVLAVVSPEASGAVAESAAALRAEVAALRAEVVRLRASSAPRPRGVARALGRFVVLLALALVILVCLTALL